MSTLEGKRIVVIGGSSGIGYSVVKTSLLSLAERVFVVSSSKTNVDNALARLVKEPQLQHLSGLEGRLTGDTLNLKDSKAIGPFFEKIGEIDHLIITGGDISRTIPFNTEDLEQHKDAFDIRFWGAAVSAQSAKLRKGGSITFTIGSALYKPRPTWSLIVGALGSVDALARALAIDLAPIRVNVVCPGAVDTELWGRANFTKEQTQSAFAAIAQKIPVQHVASPDEIAEAYLFLMKCNYITGQTIEVDGGNRLV